MQKFYNEASRILKPGALLLINEYHPFRRIWKDSKDTLSVESHYFERGPFVYDLSEDILQKGPGSLRSYEFHWTVGDYINAVLRAGCLLLFIDEHGKEVADWEGAPLHGLPEFLLIVAQKNAEPVCPANPSGNR